MRREPLPANTVETIRIERTTIENKDTGIPAVLLHPARPRGGALIMHSYGGSKEELMGLGFQVAETGLVACLIDYRGHGQNPVPLDNSILYDVTTALDFCRTFGKVTAVGHSLGGRLALLSDADYRIGISPSLDTVYGEHTCELLRSLRSYRVSPQAIAPLLAVQKNLPVWDPANAAGDTLIVYGERDVEEIIKGCRGLNERGVKTCRIPAALHQDICFLEETFSILCGQLREWYGSV